ncbi:hypothetical protein KUTeg_018948, partial [Tegillarca granosa]
MASSGRLVLAGKVCIVTGATRGIGKGIALQLGEAGATVYITGRTLTAKPNDPVGGSLKDTAKEIENRGGTCIPVQCDHSKDGDIQKLFDTVKREQNGQLDVLVNNAYAAVNAIAENMGKPFWEQPASMWDTVNNVGLRNHYMCSVEAAKLMVPRKKGLICDRMAADCAFELKKHNVTFISLWPGAVRTENLVHLLDTMGSDEGFNKGVPIENRGGTCIPVQCDHSKDEDIRKLFDTVKREQNGQLDVLVNNTYAAVNVRIDYYISSLCYVIDYVIVIIDCVIVNIYYVTVSMYDVIVTLSIDCVVFSTDYVGALAENIGKPFWEQPSSIWDTVNNVGLRNHYMCSVEAAKLMVPRKKGLIINISSAGGLRYLFNICYGVGKEACDRMAADCAFELRNHNVTFVSLWPGAVRTETAVHLLDTVGTERYNKGVP